MIEPDWEKELKKLLVADDPLALDLIYENLANDLYNYLAGIMCSVHDAEEILQELFIKIAEKKRMLSEAENIKAYLLRMAANLANDRLRSYKRKADKRESYEIFIESAEKDSSATDDEIEELNKALNEISVEQRETVTMKFFMGRTFQEMADLLGISINTAASRYRRALEELKKILEDKI